MDKKNLTQTPKRIIAHVANIVTQSSDQVIGDRSPYPLLVCAATQFALKQYNIESQIIYGHASWIEILNNNKPIWAGCWGESFHFWLVSEFNEMIDLHVSIAHRSPNQQNKKSIASAPMLWTKQIPNFYQYKPIGIADPEPTETKAQNWLKKIHEKILHKCTEENTEEIFPDEAIICSDKNLLDDTNNSFKKFDRALSVNGFPHKKPF